MKKEEILEKISNIEKTGNVKDIPFVLDNLFNNDSEISNKCFKILSDIKIKEANKILAEKLLSANNEDDIRKLLSIFWQTGLDFGEYLEHFFDIAIKYNLETSMEAMSVIENIYHNNRIDDKKLSEGIDKLKKYVISNPDDELKAKMIKEFLVIFQGE